MNTQQIKADLINAINQSNNPILLMEISKLINIDLENKEVIKLKKNQIDELKTAVSQIEKGKFITGEDEKKQSEEWLSSKQINYN